MRTTITLSDKSYQATKIKSAKTGKTFSALVEGAILQSLKDLDNKQDQNSITKSNIDTDDLINSLDEVEMSNQVYLKILAKTKGAWSNSS